MRHRAIAHTNAGSSSAYLISILNNIFQRCLIVRQVSPAIVPMRADDAAVHFPLKFGPHHR